MNAVLPAALTAETVATAHRAGEVRAPSAWLAAAGWRFAEVPELAAAFLTWLASHPPPADGRARAALAGGGDLSARARAWAQAEAGPLHAAGASAVTFATLGQLGEQVATERAAWSARRQVDPKADAEAARLWAAWPQAPFSIMGAWERRYGADAAGAFLAVAEAWGPRPDLRRELAEGLFFRCLEPRHAPVWSRIRTRILEAGPGGPLASLARHVPDGAWSALARAAVDGGTRTASALVAFPGLSGREVLARAVEHHARAGRLPALFDLHLAVRLVHAWQDPAGFEPEATWRVVTQNRGRARARLRAVLGALPPPSLPEAGLHAATRYAVRRFFYDLALEQRPLGFALGTEPAIDQPCPLAAAPTFSEAQVAMLRSFVLRGIVLGHLPALIGWLRSRSAGGGTAFYRYLKADLPTQLLVPTPADPSGREGLRAELYSQLDTLLPSCLPCLHRLVALPPAGLSRGIAEVLAAEWHPAVPLPSGRTRTFLAHAAQAIALIEGEHP